MQQSRSKHFALFIVQAETFLNALTGIVVAEGIVEYQRRIYAIFLPERCKQRLGSEQRSQIEMVPAII
jgi:hypothetical protein